MSPSTRLDFHKTVIALVSTAMASAAPTSLAQVCIDGVCFVDRTAERLIDLGGATSGLGVLDYDGDGFMDVVMGNPEGQMNRLLRNVPDQARPNERTFIDTTEGSGLDDADGAARGAFGFGIADYDNDGDPDIYALGARSDDRSFGLLYRNNGNGTFTNVTIESGLRLTGYSPESCGWADYDLDGRLDLMVAHAGNSDRSVTLFRNRGDGTFEDVSVLTPALDRFSTAYAVHWSDLDADGYPDAFIIVNGNPSTLLHNKSDRTGGRRFKNAADAFGFTRLGLAPMGIVSGDMDGDGDLDYAVSNFDSGTYYRNDGGVLERFSPFTSVFGWGNALIDVENDGDLDYYMAGSWRNPNFDRLFINDGDGDWRDASAALNGISAASRFSAHLDFNNDGLRDIITMNPNTPEQFNSVYENISTAGNHQLTVKLIGDGLLVNRDAAGAVVRLTAGGRTQVREVNIGSSTTSTDDLRQIFGLGGSEQADRIEVTWPRRGTLASRTEVYDGPFAADRQIELSPTGGFRSCESVRRLTARCNDRGRVKVTARTSLPPDTELVLSLDETRAEVTQVNESGRATARFRRTGPGSHTAGIDGCPLAGTDLDCG